MPEFPTMSQGPGHFIPDSGEEMDKDQLGFTNPNLHRRIDPQPYFLDGRSVENSYTISIYGHNSYRTTSVPLHDEESTTCEIP